LQSPQVGEPRHAQRLLGAEHRLLEGDLEVVAQVFAARAVRLRRAAAEKVAEDVAEDVLEAGGPEVEATETGALLEGGMAEAVVLRTALGVAEHLVGLGGFLEAILRLPCRPGLRSG
jgi:hypothetical protein